MDTFAKADSMIVDDSKKGDVSANSDQKRLYKLITANPGLSLAYIFVHVTTLEGDVNKNKINESLRKTLSEIHFLNAYFEKVDDEIKIFTSNNEEQFEWLYFKDLIQLEDYAYNLQKTIIPLDKPGIVKVLPCELPDRYAIIICAHHICWDASSTTQFYKRFVEHCSESKTFDNRSPEVKKPTSNRKTTNEFCRNKRLIDRHWRNKYADGGQFAILPRSVVRDELTSADAGHFSTDLSDALLKRLKNLALKKRVSFFSLCLAALKLTISYFSQNNIISVGCPFNRRVDSSDISRYGFNVQTLPLRTFIEADWSVQDLLLAVDKSVREAIFYSDIGLDEIVRRWVRKSPDIYNRAFQVMFVFRDLNIELYSNDKLRLQGKDIRKSIAKNELSVSFDFEGGKAELHFEYMKEVFSRHRIENLSASYLHCLELFASESQNEKLANLDVLTERALGELKANSFGRSRKISQSSVASLVNDAIQRYKDQTCLIDNGQAISYADLGQRIKYIENKIYDIVGSRNRGLIIGLLLPRSVVYVESMLSSIANGFIFVPLDVGLPAMRLKAFCSIAKIDIILTETNVGLSAHGLDLPIVFLDTNKAINHEVLVQTADEGDNNVIYKIFTSGSSGTPKCVLGSSDGLRNRLYWQWNKYPYEPSEKAIIKSPVHFVDSVAEILCPILKGVPSVIAEDTVLYRPIKLLECIESNCVTRLVAVPSLLAVMVDIGLKNNMEIKCLRILTSSGEKLDYKLAEKLKKLFPQALLLNIYGTSEVSADATCYECIDGGKPGIGPSVPVGKPIDNAIVAILDDNKRIVPPGATGLVYIGGVPLSMGYEIEDGSDSFVNVPIFGGVHRLFKTGDRGYLSDEFDLVICGREDGQLKINGQRLSAQEIEAILRQIDGVSDSIVMLEERSGKHFLIAYLEVKGVLREEDILIKLNKTLPLFMHPKEFYVVGEFPKLSGGKIDKINLGKMALATNRLKRSSDGDFPLTANERYIFDVLGKLLKTEVISRFDTLYSLGADSMAAVEFLHEVEKKGRLDVPPQLMLTQTVFSLAEKYQAIQEVPQTRVSSTAMR